MTRQVGEIFKYGRITLRVEKDEYPYCVGCYFGGCNRCRRRDAEITGRCAVGYDAAKWVKFVKVKEGGGK